VLALIPLALWWLKRSGLANGVGARGPQGARGTPKTVAVLPLSPQHKLVTVEVGVGEDRRWLVLGLSPQSVSTLHIMHPTAAAASGLDAAPQQAFAQLIDRMRSGDIGPTKP
jgi:flagellar protein FliO/FliZ